jgi:hypothetical protein
MQRLIKEARGLHAAGAGRRIFHWSVLDTLRRCEPQRPCSGCPLWDECQGRAKLPPTRGFISIDDAIQHKQRVGPHTWAAEMLCEQPNRSDSVYPEFDPKLHVYHDDESGPSSLGSSGPALSMNQHVLIVSGIDFGYRSPTVLLWGMMDQRQDVLHIVDELVVREHITDRIIALAEKGSRNLFGCRPAWIGADPAGNQRSEHTGVSTISLWKRAGWTVRTRGLLIEAGIQAVRRRLRAADGFIGLRIHRRCQKLIQSLSMYHYPADEPESSTPVKDGHDHAADALRYLITNLDRESWQVKRREY